MNRACIAFITMCLLAPHLPAQIARISGAGEAANSWAAVPWSYPFSYNPYYDELHSIKNFYKFWTSMDQHDPPQPIVTGTTLPPPPPATPVVHEYHWPGEANPAATFSIMTTNGTVYLATMVWVEGDNVHFNSVDGGVLVIPLSSISRSLTQTANAQKNLNLPLPWMQAGTPKIEAAPEDQPRNPTPPSVGNAVK